MRIRMKTEKRPRIDIAEIKKIIFFGVNVSDLKKKYNQNTVSKIVIARKISVDSGRLK